MTTCPICHGAGRLDTLAFTRDGFRTDTHLCWLCKGVPEHRQMRIRESRLAMMNFGELPPGRAPLAALADGRDTCGREDCGVAAGRDRQPFSEAA